MILSLIFVLRKVWIRLYLTLNKRSLFDCIYLWPALGQTIYLYQTLDYVSEEYKDYSMQSCNFVCFSTLASNLLSHIKRRT